jgi:hypothetical protein
MMKDIRKQEPLFNVAQMILIIGMFLGITLSWEYLDSQSQNINFMPLIFSVICLVLFIVMLFIYRRKIKQHNELYPTKKLKVFSNIHLNEFNSDDELFIQATNQATRKVYIFYTHATLVFALLLLFQFPYFIYFTIALSLVIIHNLIYYFHMKPYYE